MLIDKGSAVEDASESLSTASVGPFRLISRAAASGGLPISALPMARAKRSAAPPIGTPRLRQLRPALIDDKRAKSWSQEP